MMNLSAESNLPKITNILNSVPVAHVEKTKPRRKAKPWMTPHVRAKIQTGNRLQHNIQNN